MTICVCVKARDGVVLGTDSMTQVILPSATGELMVAKAYSNARKLFKVGSAPIGVMTYGAANVGHKTTYGLVQEFGRTPNKPTLAEDAQRLYEFIKGAYDSAFEKVPEEQRPGLGMYMAGLSGESALPEEWEFVFPRGQGPTRVRPGNNFGASWRGIEIPFTRLHFGFDPRIEHELRQAGVSEDILTRVFKDAPSRSPVAFDSMPIQDAINFAVYVLRTTIAFTSFELGPPACGGPLQVAAITHECGFQWVREPKYRIEEDSNG